MTTLGYIVLTETRGYWHDDWDADLHLTHDEARAAYREAADALGEEHVRLVAVLPDDPALDDPITEYGVPKSEFSEPFVRGMRKRMAVSFHKYGTVADACGSRRIDFVASERARLRKYEETGNTEWLIDAANCAMIEYMHPAHPDAHYRATDSDESPGRTLTTGDASPQHNDAFLPKAAHHRRRDGD